MTTTVIRLAVHGAAGRVGALVSRLARADSRFDVVAEIDLEQCDDFASGSVAATVPVQFGVDCSSDPAARCLHGRGTREIALGCGANFLRACAPC